MAMAAMEAREGAERRTAARRMTRGEEMRERAMVRGMVPSSTACLRRVTLDNPSPVLVAEGENGGGDGEGAVEDAKGCGVGGGGGEEGEINADKEGG